MKDSNKAKKSTRDFICDYILDALEQGVAPWTSPVGLSNQKNAKTGNEYRGINLILTNIYCMKRNLMSPRSRHWLTIRQIRELKGSLKKGSKGCPVVFYQRDEKENKETGEVTERFITKRYYVFNLEDIEGVEIPEVKHILPSYDLESYLYKNGPEVIFKSGSTPHYDLTNDRIVMPFREEYPNEDLWLSTFFHEQIHSTGSSIRLKRFEKQKEEFKSKHTEYCLEEMVAEVGSAFLAMKNNIFQNTKDDSLSYIQGWYKYLSSNRDMIFKAFSQAQKAVDYIENNQSIKDMDIEKALLNAISA